MIIAILLSGLHAMIPIGLAAIGETFNEKGGMFNIGLEGILLISGFTGALIAEVFRNWALGILAGLISGAAMGFIFAVICAYWKGDQMIAGIGINLFALGLVSFSLPAVWGTWGYHAVPKLVNVPKIHTPIGSLSIFVPITIVLCALTHYLLHKTSLGLMLKAVGENPEAADVAGVNVYLVRLIGAVYGGALCGLGGAYLSLDYLGFVTKTLPGGRGFIALACVVFSGLEPGLSLVAGLLFGFCETLGLWAASLPAIKKLIPYQFLYMIPYIATLIVTAIAVKRRRFPASMGIPYRRE
ncbi:ABC transporter permease [Candidatus Geothermarchaeota archaeon]|nr:MAG: ABC transporter permease [Candidatus Geothermarchaeota archaeon]